MTLDVLHFIDAKGGNAEEIRESQRKRGHSVEIVDEVIQMYADWVKSAYPSLSSSVGSTSTMLMLMRFVVDFEVNKLSKEVNAVQKEIGAKKKVSLLCIIPHTTHLTTHD